MKKCYLGFALTLLTFALASCGDSNANKEGLKNDEVIPSETSTYTESVEDENFDDYLTSNQYHFYLYSEDNAVLLLKTNGFGMLITADDIEYDSDTGRYHLKEDINKKEPEESIPEEYKMLPKDQIIAGDRLVFTHKEEILYTPAFYLYMEYEGKEYKIPQGEKEISEVKKCEFDRADVIKVDESLITRDSNNFVTNVNLSNYDEFTDRDEMLVIIDLNKVCIKEDNVLKWVKLSEYNGELYMSVQENVVFALYGFNPR